MTQKKETPSCCIAQKCHFNQISPPENCQECIGCPYLKNQKWVPKGDQS